MDDLYFTECIHIENEDEDEMIMQVRRAKLKKKLITETDVKKNTAVSCRLPSWSVTRSILATVPTRRIVHSYL